MTAPRRPPAPDALLTAALNDTDILPVEQALIGTVLFQYDCRIPPLLATEFLGERHRTLWTAMRDMDSRGERPRLVNLWHELTRRGAQEEVGGPAAITATFIDAATIPASIPDLANRIREAARDRMKRQLGADLHERGLSDAEISARLAALPGPLAGGIYDAGAVYQQIVKSWADTRLLTGFPRVDRLLGGITPGNLITMAARTSHGKTAYSLAQARTFAERGIPVEILTLEDSVEDITRRLLANLSGISMKRIKLGELTPRDTDAVDTAVLRLKELPLTVTGIETIRTLDHEHVLAVVGQSSSAVVVVDHLQKITTRQDSRAYGLEDVMNRLHAIALRDKRVVWVNAQLNREMESRQDAPRLSDIRDSGAVEMASRYVFLGYWPHRHDPTRPWHEWELHVAKANDAGTGTVTLRFDPSCGRFDDPDGAETPRWIHE